MIDDPIPVDSWQQMVIHPRHDGTDCVVRKPNTVCPCGTYRVRWLPVRAPVKALTMDEWIRGEDMTGAPHAE